MDRIRDMERSTASDTAWKTQGALLAVLLLALAVFYYPTFASIVAIWWRSETFAHGFLILPLCLWLVWRIRANLRATEPRANLLGIPLLIGLGVVWLLATYVDILAIQQLVVVMMIPVIVFTLLGWQTTSVMLFPLFFLIFAVPLGEELTPFLIDLTADFTVAMIRLVGIPIYREGNFFQLPTGNWSVVAACSGVRYLIASVTLGVLYAYLNYRSMFKRVLFVGAAFIVPIIANGLRAFMIVMIGHFSDMQLATGVDHIIYGWVFFGIVIAIMFYVGSFWRDDDAATDIRPLRLSTGNLAAGPGAKAVFALAALATLSWPIKAQLDQQDIDLRQVADLRIGTPGGWTAQHGAVPAWTPAYRGMDREFSAVYRNPAGEEVALYIGYYADQRQGAELANFNNVLVAELDPVWRVAQRRDQAFPVPTENLAAPLVELNSSDRRLLATYLFYAGGEIVTNKYETKLLQARAKLLGTHNDGALIALSTPHREGSDAAFTLLQRFSAEALPLVKQGLADAGAGR